MTGHSPRQPDKTTSKRQKRQHSDTLWASLYLPDLLLDTTSNGSENPPAIAVVERHANRLQVRSCNDTARHAGIWPGMALNSAYALLPALATIDYDEQREAQLLRQAGEWAMQFSSIVCLHPPCNVLIEIGASKRLFENFQTLAGSIQQGLDELGYNAQIGIAPTPLSANLLARAGLRRGVIRTQRLPAVLRDLPVEHLELDRQIIESLQSAGIREIGQLLEIPAASLTRRFGPQCPLYLAKLLGQHPDPRNPIRQTDFFQRALDLPLEVTDTNALQFTTQRMISELAAFLIARDCGINTFTFTLQHHRCADTVLHLRFLQATSQARHLHKVLTERLSQTELPEPVTGLRLLSDTFSEIERDAADLFIRSRCQQKSLGEIIDKLCSRLGADAVYTIAAVDDHRPEKAWRHSFPDRTEEPCGNWPVRPLWLLPEPRPAPQVTAGPGISKSLKNTAPQDNAGNGLILQSGPERIETGWWDDTDVRRDYFIAADQNGARYWIFQSRDTGRQFYIHGIFA